jgi:hypothetical protein
MSRFSKANKATKTPSSGASQLHFAPRELGYTVNISLRTIANWERSASPRTLMATLSTPRSSFFSPITTIWPSGRSTYLKKKAGKRLLLQERSVVLGLRHNRLF